MKVTMKKSMTVLLKMLGVAWLSLSSLSAAAQTNPATALKPTTNGNPLCPYLFTADPTAVEYEGRLYVYGTNDTQECVARNGDGNTYGAIRTLAILSTDDMVNWTYHGLIPVGDLCGSWCYNSWAPSIVSRVEADGKTHFYLYFSNSGAGIGVLTSTSPTGPWTCPIDQPLVNGATPGVGNCSAPMDPGAVIDADGTGWLAFGGGGTNSTGTDALPGNARIIKLKDNLIEVDGSASEIKAPYHFEANELNYINGKYLYTYCSTWAGRDDWASLGTDKPASGVCSMDYMVSSDPLNTDSWEYMGEYIPNPGYVPGNSWYNHHTHLHKYQGNYYAFYHTECLANAKDGVSGDFRSMAVNLATVDEATWTFSSVHADNEGVPQLKSVNPYTPQQAETTATGGGLFYENFFNLDNEATNVSDKNMVIGNIPAGAWTLVRGVDFGSKGAQAFLARLKGHGKMEIRLDNVNASAAATVTIASSVWMEQVVKLNSQNFKGKHDVYFFFSEADGLAFDEWCFTDNYVKVTGTQKQKVTGFGVASIIGNMMPPMTNPDVINYLHGDDSSIGMNIMRVEIAPVLTADPAWDDPYHWTYNTWNKFVDVVKKANEKGSLVFGTPWSPPGEYKTNGSGAGGKNENVEAKLKTENYKDFFPWLNTFLGYMKDRGAKIDAVSVQNEPDYWVGYSGCLYTPNEIRDLVKTYGHLLNADVKLMSGESLNHNPDYAKALLDDPDAAKNIDIIAGHIYGNRPLYNMKKSAEMAAAAGKETWITEHYIDGIGEGGPTWNDHLRFAQEVNESMLAGANAYVGWGIDDYITFGDNNAWTPILQRCMAMAHFAKNVKGATRLETSPEISADGEDFEYSAYVKDGALVVELVNLGDEVRAALDLPYFVKGGKRVMSTDGNLYQEQDLSIAESTNMFNVSVPAKSITTYIYEIDESVTDMEQVLLNRAAVGDDVTALLKQSEWTGEGLTAIEGCNESSKENATEETFTCEVTFTRPGIYGISLPAYHRPVNPNTNTAAINAYWADGSKSASLLYVGKETNNVQLPTIYASEQSSKLAEHEVTYRHGEEEGFVVKEGEFALYDKKINKYIIPNPDPYWPAPDGSDTPEYMTLEKTGNAFRIKTSLGYMYGAEGNPGVKMDGSASTSRNTWAFEKVDENLYQLKEVSSGGYLGDTWGWWGCVTGEPGQIHQVSLVSKDPEAMQAGTTYYLPNWREDAVVYFQQGLYENNIMKYEVKNLVDGKKTVTVGLKKNGEGKLVFGDLAVTYLGATEEEADAYLYRTVFGDWIGVAGSADYRADIGFGNNCYEFWESNWGGDNNRNNAGTYIYQDLKLKKGTYNITMNAYYGDARYYQNWEDGVFYVQMTPGSNTDDLVFHLPNVTSQRSNEPLHAEATIEKDDNGNIIGSGYYPANLPSSQAYFEAGYYACNPGQITVTEEEQTVRFGFRKYAGGDYSKVCFSNLQIERVSDNVVSLGTWSISEGGSKDENDGCTEVWEAVEYGHSNPSGTYIYQDLTLEQGVYDITLNGYYRQAERDDNGQGAQFFVQSTPGSTEGEKTQELPNVTDTRITTAVYGKTDGANCDKTIEVDGKTYYYPYSTAASKAYFDAGHYQVEPVRVVVSEAQQTIRVGVRKNVAGFLSAILVGNVAIKRIDKDVTMDVAIGEADIATLCYPTTALRVPEGVEAYTVANYANEYVQMVPVANGIIPAGEPVVLKGAKGEYAFAKVTDIQYEKNAENLLRGADAYGNMTAETGVKYYKLAKDATNGLGFYYGVADGSMFRLTPTGRDYQKAYMVLSEGVAEASVRVLFDEVTEIEDVDKDPLPSTLTPILYNLAGQKVSADYRGIAIKNGKKVLMK